MTDPSFAQIRTRYLAAIAAATGAASLDRVETVVVPERNRAGSGMAVAYHVGSPTRIRADPALAGALDELTSSTIAVDADAFRSWACERGWRFVDGGDLHIVSPDQLRVRALPPGAELVELDGAGADDRSRIADFLGASDYDDVDAAEFDIEDLDPHIVGLIDDRRRLIAMASGRIWENDPDFDDIAVMTRPDHRGEGWGAAVVAAFCVASFERDRLPLYRCNWSRVASKALASSLGFQLVGQLTAVASPDKDQDSTE